MVSCLNITWIAEAILTCARRRLVKPFLPLASASTPVTASEPLEGFEGAGMGKLVQLKERLPASRVVEMVKSHLGLKYGASAELPASVRCLSR